MKGTGALLVWPALLGLVGCTIIKEPSEPQPPPAEPPAQAEQPATPVATKMMVQKQSATAPVVVSAVEQPASAATNNCGVLVITARRGGEVLDEARFQDDCTDAPGRNCDDDGHDCAEKLHGAGASLDLGEQSFTWMTYLDSWHHGDMETTALYGYVCGELKEVFSYTSSDQGEHMDVVLTAVGGNWKTLQAAITTEADGSKENEQVQLTWDEASCTYK